MTPSDDDLDKRIKEERARIDNLIKKIELRNTLAYIAVTTMRITVVVGILFLVRELDETLKKN